MPEPQAGRCILVMTRLPRPGEAKTRLIPALGAQGAAELQRRLSERVVTRARRLRAACGARILVCHAGGDAPAMGAWLGGDLEYAPQRGEDLGQRMAAAFDLAFATGSRRVVMVGADLPELDETVMRRAFKALERADAAFAPAEDGGYGLVGLKRPRPELFRGIDWGSGLVFAQSLAKARKLGLAVARLPLLWDLDRPEDLLRWRILAEREDNEVCVIIPALNEAANLGCALAPVLAESPDEVILADGGSRDRTRELARELGLGVITPGRGRARQMNAAASLALSGNLLFLHADTILPPGWKNQVRGLLQKPGVAAGAFGFSLDRSSPGLRFIEMMVALRCALFGLPYGDQALFLRRRLFRELGGFPDWPILEDVELIRRAKTRGKIEISRLPAVTSARRWQRRGIWRTTGLNLAIMAARPLKISLPTLRRLYDRLDL